MSYPGGKSGAGVYHRLGAAVPPHRLMVVPFAGRCGLSQHLALQGTRRLMFDIDPDVVAWWRGRCRSTTVELGDGVAWLSTASPILPVRALVYADPPYPLGTRTKKRIYKREWSDEQHAEFLDIVVALPCYVMVSTYPNAIYDRVLARAGWRSFEFEAMTRGGLRTEQVWHNYELPEVPHDPYYGGVDFRDRERIKRKAARWTSALRAMTPADRVAILAAIDDERSRIDASADIVTSGGGRSRRRPGSACSIATPGGLVVSDGGRPSSLPAVTTLGTASSGPAVSAAARASTSAAILGTFMSIVASGVGICAAGVA